MMVKRKRAPGGGRKRQGASVAQNLTIRIDSAMRGQLEFAALKRAEWKRNWNLSQEILMRLKQSLDREREERRKPAVRAIGFLIAEMAEFLSADLREPFAFQAFKLAVAEVLDAIKPPGEIREGPGRYSKTPGEVASVVARAILHKLFTAELTEDLEPQLRKSLGAVVSDGHGGEMLVDERLLEIAKRLDVLKSRDFYAMSDVRRDLALDLDKGESGK